MIDLIELFKVQNYNRVYGIILHHLNLPSWPKNDPMTSIVELLAPIRRIDRKIS